MPKTTSNVKREGTTTRRSGGKTVKPGVVCDASLELTPPVGWVGIMTGLKRENP
jgi:hypothetical protein